MRMKRPMRARKILHEILKDDPFRNWQAVRQSLEDVCELPRTVEAAPWCYAILVCMSRTLWYPLPGIQGQTETSPLRCTHSGLLRVRFSSPLSSVDRQRRPILYATQHKVLKTTTTTTTAVMPGAGWTYAVDHLTLAGNTSRVDHPRGLFRNSMWNEVTPPW